MSDSFVTWLNVLGSSPATDELRKCCGASWWCKQMVAARPYNSMEHLHRAADRTFDVMPHTAWLEAFASHPRIGNTKSEEMKLDGNREWSAKEQSGIAMASEQLQVRLREANTVYFDRFGYSYIVCATGKSAGELLAILEQRLTNDPEEELAVATREQRKITHLRLDKLANEHEPHPENQP